MAEPARPTKFAHAVFKTARLDFDPVRLLERFRRGDPVSQLVKQGSA